MPPIKTIVLEERYIKVTHEPRFSWRIKPRVRVSTFPVHGTYDDKLTWALKNVLKNGTRFHRLYARTLEECRLVD